MPPTVSNKLLIPILIVMASLLFGCNKKIDGYTSAASITKNGFAQNRSDLQKNKGQEIKVWGFVDHSNIYGDESAKDILEEWWSGAGPNATTWRFNLMAEEPGEGRSFAVYVPNDQGRDELLRTFLADARAQKPTRVFVKGKLSTFEAPTNASTLTGVYLEVRSSQDILLGFPKKD